jgi:PAS domain S-box-containing protein
VAAQTGQNRLTQRYTRDFLTAFSGRVLIATTAMVFLLVCCLVGIQAVADRGRILANGQARAQTVAAALASYVDKTIDGADSALNSILAQGILTDLGGAQGRTAALALLRSHTTTDIFHFTVLDKSGRVVISSEGESLTGLDLSSQGNYLALAGRPILRRHVGRGTGRFGLGAGKSVFVISHAITDANGAFAGLIYTTVATGDLESLYENLRFDGITSARLIAFDGEPLFELASTRENRGEDNPVATATTSGREAFLQVELDPRTLLAEWRHRYKAAAGIVAVLGAVIAGLTAFSIIIQARRERAAEAATLQVERLAKASVIISKLDGRAVMLQYACDAVRDILGCGHAIIAVRDRSGAQIIEACSPPGRLFGCGVGDTRESSADHEHARSHNQPLRAGQDAIAGTRMAAQGVHNWMVIPLVAPDIDTLGMLEAFNKHKGDFTPEDQAVCVQMAQLVAVALTKLELIEAERNAHVRALTSLDKERRASEELARILATISDGFVTLDRDWRFTYANREAEDILKLGKEQLLGKIFWDVFPHARDSVTWNEFHAARADKQARSYEVFNKALGKWLGVRVFPSETGLSLFFRDETLRRQAALQLQQAQRMETIGQLTGGIAHDFNNLLTVVIGNADNLMELTGPESELHEGLELIRMAGQRGADLTQRLLAFARRQALEPAAVDVAETLSSIESLVQRAVGEAVNVAIVAPSNLWRALVDPVQLETAILNLAINARDAMPSGGDLSISAGNVVLSENYAGENIDVKPGDYVKLDVTDTGTGMSPEVLARAFDPFFTTKPVGKGTGLGLSMVYGLVKQSGGHVRLQSTLGRGTKVTLYLPRAINDASNTSTGDVPPGRIARGTEVILLVEDDALVRQYTSTQLASLGYKVVLACNAAEACAVVDAGLRPDLLLTDIVLPGGVNGRELAESLLAKGQIQRVLYTSGYSENAIAHAGRLDPGVVLLSKPFGRESLAKKVRDAFSLTMA